MAPPVSPLGHPFRRPFPLAPVPENPLFVDAPAISVPDGSPPTRRRRATHDQSPRFPPTWHPAGDRPPPVVPTFVPTTGRERQRNSMPLPSRQCERRRQRRCTRQCTRRCDVPCVHNSTPPPPRSLPWLGTQDAHGTPKREGRGTISTASGNPGELPPRPLRAASHPHPRTCIATVGKDGGPWRIRAGESKGLVSLELPVLASTFDRHSERGRRVAGGSQWSRLTSITTVVIADVLYTEGLHSINGGAICACCTGTSGFERETGGTVAGDRWNRGGGDGGLQGEWKGTVREVSGTEVGKHGYACRKVARARGETLTWVPPVRMMRQSKWRPSRDEP